MSSIRLRAASAQAAAAVRGLVLCLPLALAGCSYLDTLMSRRASPDTRIVLDWQERRSLSEREVQRYTCPAKFLLTCERGGASTYSCTCQLL